MPISDVHFMATHERLGNDCWETPDCLFQALDAEFGPFTLDACANQDNYKVSRYFSLQEDSLSQTWEGVVFMNPPYGRQIARFVEKAYRCAEAGATVVCLLPCRTCTTWWARYVMKAVMRRPFHP